jgi:hypothetical protein
MFNITNSTKFLIFIAAFIFFYGPVKKMSFKGGNSPIVSNGKVCIFKTDPNKTKGRQIKELLNTQILMAPIIVIPDQEFSHITIDIMFHKYKELAKDECKIEQQK